MIDLSTAGTPNGHKASVTLEEPGLPYEVHPVNLSAGDDTDEGREKFIKGARNMLQN